MLNIIIGSALILLGLWGMLTNWLMFVDIFKLLVLLGLVGFGIIAFLAGIKQLKISK